MHISPKCNQLKQPLQSQQNTVNADKNSSEVYASFLIQGLSKQLKCVFSVDLKTGTDGAHLITSSTHLHNSQFKPVEHQYVFESVFNHPEYVFGLWKKTKWWMGMESKMFLQ